MTFKLEGMKELEKAIEKLTKSIGADNTEPILFSAAEIVTAEVQSRVNGIKKHTGNLSKSPTTKMMDKRRGDEPRPSISAIDRKIAPHAHLLEFGTSKMAATPFFRPSWDSKRGPALDHIKKELSKAVKEGVR